MDPDTHRNCTKAIMTYPNRRIAILSGLILLALLALIGYSHAKSSASGDAPSTKTAPVLVSTAEVSTRPMPHYLSGVGTVTANASVTVKIRVDGQLKSLNFAEGQDVKAGQVLAQIDPDPLKAQLEQSQAQQAKDEALLGNSRLDLQRYTQLAETNSISRQALDTQRALVAQQQAAVKNDKALVRYNQVQLNYTTIRAPISGRTGGHLVDAGNMVHASDTTGLVVINQVDPILVQFTLPEQSFQDINNAMRNSKQALAVEAYDHNSGQNLAKGQLIMLNNQIDTSNGTIQLKSRFTNQDHHLWPGQYIDVHLILGTDQQALTLPAPAIQRGANGTYVYLVGNDHHVSMQPVRVSRIQDNIAIIDSGLKAGARVVVDGQYKLKPGSQIIESGAAHKGSAK
jgi:multidrug efflux system membrane fusion protein